MGQMTLKYMSLAMVVVTGVIAFLIGLYIICLGLGGCFSAIYALFDNIF